MQRIAVFGATGQTGRLISRLLLESEDLAVTACSRTPEKLARLEASLTSAGSRLTTKVVDLDRDADVNAAADEADLIVGATSRWQDGPTLATRAVESSTHYCGIYLSNPAKWTRLRQLTSRSVDGDVMVVDDCGTHPGLPAAMVRWVAQRVPLHSAWVGARFDLEWNRLELARETIADFGTEIESTDPAVFEDGRWKRGYRHTRRFDFDDGHGPQTCTPMLLEEMRELAEAGRVTSTGFFIAGFGPILDYGVLPLSMALSKIYREAARGLLWWGLRHFASRPETAVVQLEAEREGNGDPVRLRVSHPDPYYLTAAPVVSTIHQMLREPRAGVWTQGSFVEPEPFFESLRGMGVSVDVRMDRMEGYA